MPDTETLTVEIDDELLQAMEVERDLVGDTDLSQTIERRLSQGVHFARVVGVHDLLWRPVRNGALPIDLQVSRSVFQCLENLVAEFEYPLSVVVCTILFNDACKPWEVREVERSIPFGPTAWQPGKGNIYSIRFDLPGYQIVFLKLLGRSATERDDVVGEALLALARQVRQLGMLSGQSVSDDALEFAGKMVRNADRRQRAPHPRHPA